MRARARRCTAAGRVPTTAGRSRPIHSEPAAAGYTFKRTLEKTGRYRIVCTLHEEMRMTITVRR